MANTQWLPAHYPAISFKDRSAKNQSLMKNVISLFILVFFLSGITFAAHAEDFDKKAITLEVSHTNDLQEFQASVINVSTNKPLFNGEELSFEHYLDLVKKNHPDIIYGDIERSIAKSKRLEAQGAFDPSIN